MPFLRSIVAGFFLSAAASASALPCAGFVDVEDTSPFCASVEWMRNRAITNGCESNRYCPDQAVTRLQMAAFMNRMNRLLPPTLVDSNDQAIASVFARSSSGVITAFYKASNGAYFLNVEQLPSNYTLQYYFSRNTVFFEYLGCTGRMFIGSGTWPYPFPTASRIGTIARTPSSDFSLFRTVAPALPAATTSMPVNSYYSGMTGACLNQQGISAPNALEVEFVEDLALRYTEPLYIK